MLKENELKALIALLDDDDPMVSEQVWSRLTDLGREGVDRLEAEWEIQADPNIQHKIEEVIHKIFLRETTQDILDWRKGGGLDLLQGWFLATRLQYPTLDFQPYKNGISRLANKIWLEINDRMEPYQKVRVINHVLFVMEGFSQGKGQSQSPGMNFVNTVLDQQKGNALSFGMFYLLICQKLDLPVSGVLLPGYFLLLFNDGAHEFFIDPYMGGKMFSKNDLQRFLEQAKIEEKPAYFKPTSNIYILLSLLQNLANDYKVAGEVGKQEEIEDLLKAIEIRF